MNKFVNISFTNIPLKDYLLLLFNENDYTSVSFNWSNDKEIKRMKDSWSREEVIELIIDAVGESHDWSKENNNIHSIGIIKGKFLDKWIEENL